MDPTGESRNSAVSPALPRPLALSAHSIWGIRVNSSGFQKCCRISPNPRHLWHFRPQRHHRRKPVHLGQLSTPTARRRNRELADALDRLEWPAAITLSEITRRGGGHHEAECGLDNLLTDRRSRRIVPYRMGSIGYVPVRNQNAKDGLWIIGGKRQSIYAKSELSHAEQTCAAKERQARGQSKQKSGYS